MITAFQVSHRAAPKWLCPMASQNLLHLDRYAASSSAAVLLGLFHSTRSAGFSAPCLVAPSALSAGASCFKPIEPALYGAHGRNDFIQVPRPFQGQFALFSDCGNGFLGAFQLATRHRQILSMQLTKANAAIRFHAESRGAHV